MDNVVYLTDIEMFNRINNINFGDKIIFFKFGGPWCVPCKSLERTLCKIENCLIYNIDVDNEKFDNYIATNNITSIPYTIVKYKTNTMSFKGNIDHVDLESIISELKNK
jgi:thiol-disulfide isomerase/thioredoxin